MARAVGRPRKVRTTDEEEFAPDPLGPTERTTDALSDLEDEGQRPPEARIHRIGPIDGKPKFLQVANPDLVTEPWLQKTFGGGEYVVEVYGTRQDGTFGYLKGERRKYSIDDSIPFKGPLSGRVYNRDEPIRREREDEDDDADMKMLFKSQLLNLIKEQNETRGTSMSLLMQMMSQMNQANQQFMTAMSSLLVQGRQQPNGLGELKEVIGPLLTGVISKKDPVEVAASLIALMRPPEGESKGGLSMVREALEIADMMGGRGNRDPDDKWLDMVKEMGPEALGLVRQIMARQNPPGARTPTPPLPPGGMPSGVNRVPPPALASVPSGADNAPSAGASSSLPESEMKDDVPQDEWTPLVPHMERLLEAARTNKPPHHVVGLVMLLTSAEQQALLRELVAQDDVITAVTTRFPEFQRHPTWLAEFVDELRAEFGLVGDEEEGDVEGEDEPVNASGDDAA